MPGTVHPIAPAHRYRRAMPAMRQVLIRMPAELHEAVRRQADAEDRTMAAHIRRLLLRIALEAEGAVKPASNR